MSEKPKEPKSKIEDLPEKTDELSAEALDQVAGGAVRSPGKTNLPIRHVSLSATSMVTDGPTGSQGSIDPVDTAADR